MANRMNNIIHIPPIDFVPHPGGVGYFFYEHMLKYKDKIAQIDGLTGAKDTYGSLLQRCIRTAKFLQKLNIRREDFISVCTFNHINSCTPLIASFFVNAITCSVDPTLSVNDIIQLLEQTPPKVIFVGSEAVHLIEQVVEKVGFDLKIIVFGDSDKHIPFARVLEPSANEIDFKPVPVESLDDTCIIVFSSGTSGLPKPICHKHYSLMYSYVNHVNGGFNFNLSFGFYSPYWTLFSNSLGICLVAGTTRLILPKFDVNNPWEPFYHKITTVILNIFQVLTLCSTKKPEWVDTSSLECLGLTGGDIKNEQLLKVEKLFPNAKVYNMYGQSEVIGHLTHFCPSDPIDRKLHPMKPNSVGTGLPGISYKIVAIDNEAILGPNQEGELRLKTKLQLKKYLGIDSVDLWDSDGWLKTGDIAYYDDDLCFYIVDRIKEMFKYQGSHIAPAIIEAILLQHPAVVAAVVIGIPHPIDGYWPTAIVNLKPGHDHNSVDDIQQFVHNKVQDRQKLRGGIHIVDSFPLTASGKINRRKLKEMFEKL